MGFGRFEARSRDSRRGVVEVDLRLGLATRSRNGIEDVSREDKGRVDPGLARCRRSWEKEEALMGFVLASRGRGEIGFRVWVAVGLFGEERAGG